MNPAIFRAYDIRGIYPKDIDEEAVYLIARAYIRWLKQKNKKPRKIALGKDVRISSPALWQAGAQGLIDEGVKAFDIGTISTDMLYFAVADQGFDGGLIISASHNPAEYNGMKIVIEKAIPVSSDSGLLEIGDIALKMQNSKCLSADRQANLKMQNDNAKLKIIKKDILDDYIRHVLGFVDPKKIKPMKVVANANFGMAGVAAEKIIKKGKLPIKLIKLNCQPDGSFPKGRPDPLVPENRQETSDLVKKSEARLAVAWDADGDRCFFFDEKGQFVTPAFMTALMVKHLLRGKRRREKIINDTRIFWPVEDAVKEAGGQLVLTKAGHTFIKERMRQENALFGGETSAHYFYRDNFYADNGMISFLLVLEILSEREQKLSEIIAGFRQKYAVSDEINFEVKDPEKVLAVFEKKYKDGKIDKRDGLSINYSNWRFSLRASHTEPLIRLNVETRGDYGLLDEKIKELSHLIDKP